MYENVTVIPYYCVRIKKIKTEIDKLNFHFVVNKCTDVKTSYHSACFTLGKRVRKIILTSFETK